MAAVEPMLTGSGQRYHCVLHQQQHELGPQH
jgi:hypothetical protein